jgi:hypothetical protein
VKNGNDFFTDAKNQKCNYDARVPCFSAWADGAPFNYGWYVVAPGIHDVSASGTPAIAVAAPLDIEDKPLACTNVVYCLLRTPRKA